MDNNEWRSRRVLERLTCLPRGDRRLLAKNSKISKRDDLAREILFNRETERGKRTTTTTTTPTNLVVSNKSGERDSGDYELLYYWLLFPKRLPATQWGTTGYPNDKGVVSERATEADGSSG